MNKIALSAIFIICIFSSCQFAKNKIEGNGRLEKENRTINNISKIRVKGDIQVMLKNGLENALVEADANLIPYIVTEVDGDWYNIHVKKGYELLSSNPITVKVSLPEISEIDLTGSGDIIGQGMFSNKNNIQLLLSGSGRIEMNVNAPEIFSKITGSGDINLKGETRTLNSSVAGSGNMNCENLKTEKSEVVITGSGNAKVFSDINLKAVIKGSGNIYYKGNATVDKKITGSGEVIKEP